jgi:hypothetical protein
MLLGGIIGSPGLLASLAVLLGEISAALQCFGQLRQDARGRLGALPRLTHDEVGSAYLALASVRIDQAGPSTLQLGSAALVLGHLALKASALRITSTLPELRGALMVSRRNFVTVGSVPVGCLVVTHHRPSMRPKARD